MSKHQKTASTVEKNGVEKNRNEEDEEKHTKLKKKLRVRSTPDIFQGHTNVGHRERPWHSSL